ncbi:hypothetical protein I79_012309 [Cricetulus griseus]|uniref:Uncharacterized protein n=1 Tax=Cricetulus griseus TaxID=10029 RepID=G3HNH1_CRIGR|nr:hypothetical protein I79_012309 [Cricetulus griseus]
MKNKQALLFTKAEDSVKGCRIQLSQYLVELFCFPGALRGQAPWKGEGLCSCLLDLCCCLSFHVSASFIPGPSKPPWKAKHKLTPWQSSPPPPEDLEGCADLAPIRKQKDSSENGGLNTCAVPVQLWPGRSCSGDQASGHLLPRSILEGSFNLFAACYQPVWGWDS